jgi:hypothetical protein
MYPPFVLSVNPYATRESRLNFVFFKNIINNLFYYSIAQIIYISKYRGEIMKECNAVPPI